MVLHDMRDGETPNRKNKQNLWQTVESQMLRALKCFKPNHIVLGEPGQSPCTESSAELDLNSRSGLLAFPRSKN